MTCREILEFLADYLDGVIADADRVRFEQHLDECPDCVAYLATYAATPDVLRTAMLADSQVEALPEELVQVVVESLRSAGTISPEQRRPQDHPRNCQ